MFSDDEKEVEIERARHGYHPQSRAGEAWASAAGFIFLLLFIGTLIYLAHNHWHF